MSTIASKIFSLYFGINSCISFSPVRLRQQNTDIYGAFGLNCFTENDLEPFYEDEESKAFDLFIAYSHKFFSKNSHYDSPKIAALDAILQMERDDKSTQSEINPSVLISQYRRRNQDLKSRLINKTQLGASYHQLQGGMGTPPMVQGAIVPFTFVSLMAGLEALIPTSLEIRGNGYDYELSITLFFQGVKFDLIGYTSNPKEVYGQCIDLRGKSKKSPYVLELSNEFMTLENDSDLNDQVKLNSQMKLYINQTSNRELIGIFHISPVDLLNDEDPRLVN